MRDDIHRVLDECMVRLEQGETVERCLAEHPHLRQELEPLIRMAVALKMVPRPSVSPEFRRTAEARLMTRLRAESIHTHREHPQRVHRGIGNFILRPLVPVVLMVLAVLLIWVGIPGVFPPNTVYAAELTLSILKGSAEIQTSGASVWTEAADGTMLEVGTRLRTSAESHVLLTFFDGSTSKLEPGTEITILQSEYDSQETARIALEQDSGKTWNHVMVTGRQLPDFSVQTPQGKALAQGTSFSVEVVPSGITKIEVAEGAVEVTERDERGVRLVANQHVQIGTEPVQAAAVPMPAAVNEMVITTGVTGIGSVRDPSGASTGSFPNGLSFNQITRSMSSLTASGQVIQVEQPASGEYIVAVRTLIDEPTPVNIEIKREGQVVFQQSEVLPAVTGDGWTIRISITTTDNATITGKIVSIKPIAGKSPETVVETVIAKRRAVPLSPRVNPSKIPRINPLAPSRTTVPDTTQPINTPVKPTDTTVNPTIPPIQRPSIAPTVVPIPDNTPVKTPTTRPVEPTTAPVRPTIAPVEPTATPAEPSTTPAPVNDGISPITVPPPTRSGTNTTLNR